MWLNFIAFNGFHQMIIICSLHNLSNFPHLMDCSLPIFNEFHKMNFICFFYNHSNLCIWWITIWPIMRQMKCWLHQLELICLLNDIVGFHWFQWVPSFVLCITFLVFRIWWISNWAKRGSRDPSEMHIKEGFFSWNSWIWHQT